MKTNLIKTIILPVLLVIVLVQYLKADPEIKYGNDGVTVWSAPKIDYDDFYSINDGEAVMLVWSERDPVSELIVNYMQIVRSDGKTATELPTRLTTPGMICNRVNSISDSDGNIFLTWVEEIPDDTTGVYIKCKKYNSSGESLWDIIQQRRDFKRRRSNERNRIDYRIGGVGVDNIGGLYLSTKDGVIALNESGKIRENWDSPKIESYSRTIDDFIPDHSGGFWYRYKYTDWAISFGHSGNQAKRNKGFNHFDYYGSHLWDENGWFTGDGPSEDILEGGSVEMTCFKSGSVILLRSKKKQRSTEDDEKQEQTESNTLYEQGFSVHQVDENGNYRGKEYSHLISSETSSSTMINLRDDRCFILNIIKDSTETSLWATIYDPINNSFPWSKKGMLIGNWIFENNYNKQTNVSLYTDDGFNFVQLENGDVIFSINFDPVDQAEAEWTEIFRLSLSGESVWEHPYTIVKRDLVMYEGDKIHTFEEFGSWRLRYKHKILSGLSNGFWLASYKHSLAHNGQPNFTLYDEKGKSVNKDIQIDGISNGYGSKVAAVWKLGNDNLKAFLFNSWQGLRLIEINNDGIKSRNDDDLIIPMLAENVQSVERRLKEMMLLLLCPSYNSYDFESPVLIAVDLDGNLLWKIELGEEVQIPKEKGFHVAVSPDEKHAAVMISMMEQSHYCRLFWIDLSNGKLLWERNLFPTQQENDRQARWKYESNRKNDVLVCKDGIYGLGFTPSDSIKIVKFDYNGNEAWDKPRGLRMKHGRNLAGTAMHENDGIYVFIEQGDWDIVGVLARQLHSNGDWNKQEFYAHKYANPEIPISSYSYEDSPFRTFCIVNSGNNMWIAPTRLGQFGVQCISFPWNRLLGDFGYIPGNIDLQYKKSRNLESNYVSDHNGGLWAIYENGVKILHFNNKGDLNDGWSEEGIQIFIESEVFTEFKGFSVSDSEIVITSSDRDGDIVKLQQVTETK